MAMANIAPKHYCAATSPKPSASEHKRKFEVVKSPDGAKSSLFPIFSPSSSPSRASKSPSSSSPSRKRANRILKQGANQNNKILRYLQPKRLLPSFDNQSASKAALPVHPHINEEKENKVLDLKVTLVRIDDVSYKEHSYCMLHKGQNKLCCTAASEYVVNALEDGILENVQDPCKRLGISVPKCITASGCNHEEISDSSSPQQSLLFSTMVDADLKVMMIRACCLDLSSKYYPSPAIIRAIFTIMKESADKKTIEFGRSYLKRVVAYFPPCNPKMRLYYLNILHSGNMKERDLSAGMWSLRTLEFFEETLTEVETLIECMLSPSQLKQKFKTPGTRRIRKPSRYAESSSPVEQPNFYSLEDNYDFLSSEAMKKQQLNEDKIIAMSLHEKIDHVFSRFEVLVDILEWDLVVWLCRNVDYSNIRIRPISPLIVLALWRPESDTGYDSVHCRRIISLYVSAWVLKLNPRHLRTLGRLIGMIAEVTSASEPNHGNVHPHSGEGCDNLARKLSDALKNTQMEDVRVKAVRMLKPDWLQMHVSANLLGIFPSISSMGMKILLEPMSDTAKCLWAIFLDAVMDIYHLKDALRLLQQVSKGFYKEEFTSKSRTVTSSHQINYRALHNEISAFYNLRCQVKQCFNTTKMHELLLQILLMEH